jgi:hypothetical protein
MPVLVSQPVPQNHDRTYHVQVPANPAQATVPATVVFHGGGRDAVTIARPPPPLTLPPGQRSTAHTTTT